MVPYDQLRYAVRDRIDGLLAERRHDALADRAAAHVVQPPVGRRLLAWVGLGLIRAGERLRDERWAPWISPHHQTVTVDAFRLMEREHHGPPPCQPPGIIYGA